MTDDQYRVRIVFSKRGIIRYISHLELFRAWERALRRADLPIVYSEGFNPRPKLQLAAALPLGYIGEAEMLDVWLESRVSVDEIERRLGPVLPDGLGIVTLREVDLVEPALQTRVVAACYRVLMECPEDYEQVTARVQRILGAEELPQERRGRIYDLRKLILGLTVISVEDGSVVFEMKLAAREGATGRPEAVLSAMQIGGAFSRICRQRLIFDESE